MKSEITAKDRVVFLAGLAVSLAALAGLLLWVDLRRLGEIIQQIRPLVLLPILLLLVISLITRAAGWRLILGRKISLQQSFWIINSGYFVNTVLPFRLGELTRAFLLLPAGFVFLAALAGIILERLFDIGFALILFFSSLPPGWGGQSGVGSAIPGLLVVGLGALLLVLAARYSRSWLERLRKVNFLPRGSIQRLETAFGSVSSLVGDLIQTRRLIWVFLLMGASWAIALLYQHLLLLEFVPQARLSWAAFSLGALALGVSIPSSPGNIGVYEASITLALSALGVDRDLAFAYALTSHILSLLVTTSLGAFGLVRQGVALRDIWRMKGQPISGEEE